MRNYKAIIKAVTGRSDPSEINGIYLLLSVREDRALDDVSDQEIRSLVRVAEDNFTTLRRHGVTWS